jgi:hypothetical protein
MTRHRIPIDSDLYEAIVEEAKARFAVWPSAYASGWVVKTYKERGGRYGGGGRGQDTGLVKWFGEEWVDLSRPIHDEDGNLVGYEPCGRKRSTTPADYPKCRPFAEAVWMTPAEIKDAVRRKRRTEETAPARGERARPPARVATYRANPTGREAVLEDIFYHVTSFASVEGIAVNGLNPRRGGGVYSHGGYGEHSQGKVFLAGDKDAALAWYGKIQDMLWHHYSDDEEPDNLVPVMLRVDLSLTMLEADVDPLGDRDVPGSYFVTRTIPPEALEFFDPPSKEWLALEDWDADPYAGVKSIEYFNAEGDVVDEDDVDEYGDQAWTTRGFSTYDPYDDGGFKPSRDDEEAWGGL